MLGSIRGMWGSLKAGPGLSHVSGYRRRRVRRRGSPSSLLLAASCALLVAPAWSRAFVVSPVVKDANSRFPFGSSRAQAGRGPPYRRRARGGVGRARTNRGPTLSVASPVEERPRLMDMAWPILMSAEDPHAGVSPDAGDLESVEASRLKHLEGRGQTGFEGPEKTVEIEFDPHVGHEDGLRAVRREQWDAILEQATLPGKWSQELLDSLSKFPVLVYFFSHNRIACALDEDGGDTQMAFPDGFVQAKAEHRTSFYDLEPGFARSQAQCQILHHRGNECFDSYVLSESSLFVYKSKLVLKTCGTTTLLRCLPLLTVVTKNYGLSLEWIGYSRKDFTFPTDQIYPHTSFAQEVDFLQTMFTGSAYVHGPLNSDHWYTYVADDGKRPDSAVADRTLNLMMYDLEPEIAQNFFKTEEIQTAEDVSRRSGIRKVLDKATLQDHLFDPCGYSLNALEGRAYYTVHVTPEPDFSYASFETNIRLPDYDNIVQAVLEVFRPRKFTMTLFAEKTGMEEVKRNPFDACSILCRETEVSTRRAMYMRTLTTMTNFAGDYLSQMGNWVREPSEATVVESEHEVLVDSR